MAIEEWSGLRSSSALDQTASAYTATGTSGGTGTTATTTQANEMFAAAIAVDSTSGGTGTSTDWSAPTNSFTLNVQENNGNPLGLATLYRVVSATGTYTTAATNNQVPDFAGVIATYKTMGTNYTSQATGNWSSSSTWTPTGVPGSGDTATIANGTTVTVDTNVTVGSNSSGIGAAVTINGASSSSYGTLQMTSSGASLTLQGFDKTTNTLMTVNRYGQYNQSAGTIYGSPGSDYSSIILNKGQMSFTGGSVSSPSGNVSWSTSSSGETLGANKGIYKYLTTWPTYIYVLQLNYPYVANSGGTGLGSYGNSSLSFSVSVPSGGLATEVSSLAGVTTTGQYFVDYINGIVYYYTNNVTLTGTATYQYLSMSKTWGIQTTQGTTYNSFTSTGTTFNYMGQITNSANNAAILVQSCTGTGNQQFSFTNNTMQFCGLCLGILSCTGTSANPLNITGNTFYHGITTTGSDLQPTYGSIIGCYEATSAYLYINNNTVNTRSALFTAFAYTPTLQTFTGFQLNNNTGTCGVLAYGKSPMNAFPAGQIQGNTITGVGQCLSYRTILGMGGTSGSPIVISGNTFNYSMRVAHHAPWFTFTGNASFYAYHHGTPADVNSDCYYPGIIITDNLFYGPATNSVSNSPAIELGYNYRQFYDAPIVANNTSIGYPQGCVGFGDCQDVNLNNLIVNAYVVNNLAYYTLGSNTTYGAQRTADSTNKLARVHCLQFDNNCFYGTSGGTGTSGSYYSSNLNKTGLFTLSGGNYNTLTSSNRNLPGLALFSPTASFPTSQIAISYTDTSAGVTETLKLSTNNGSSYGTAVSIVNSHGSVTTYAAGTTVVNATDIQSAVLLNDTSQSWSTTLNNSGCPRARWLKVTSGKLSGQVRATTNNAATTITITPPFNSSNGGLGYGPVTAATNASPIVVTSAGHGLSVNDYVYIANCVNNTGANGLWLVSAVSGSTFTLSGSTGTGSGTVGQWCAVPNVGDTYTIYESEVTLTDASSNSVNVGICGYTGTSYPVFGFGGSSASDTGITYANHDVLGTDPLLVNESTGTTAASFKLTASSPAKGAGKVVSNVTPTTDYFGTTFASPPSIGFAEYVSAGGLPLMFDVFGMGGGMQGLDGGMMR
jgi:hypothetical protein